MLGAIFGYTHAEQEDSITEIRHLINLNLEFLCVLKINIPIAMMFSTDILVFTGR